MYDVRETCTGFEDLYGIQTRDFCDTGTVFLPLELNKPTARGDCVDS